MGRIERVVAAALISLWRPLWARETVVYPAVTVWIYDYSHLSRGTLSEAERTFKRRLEEAGIRSNVVLCSTDSQTTLAKCMDPLALAPLIVRIMPGVPPDGSPQLGVSVGTTLATVYYQRALQFALKQPASGRVPVGRILGYAIAHEIGHLLVPSMPHARNGVMGAAWGLPEQKLMGSGALQFSAEEANAMQTEVTRRAARTAQAESR